MKNNNWKKKFEGEYLDIWQTPKGEDGSGKDKKEFRGILDFQMMHRN